MSDPTIEFPLAAASNTLVNSVPEDYFDPFLPCLDATVEEQSLQQSMDVNKESLKRKLMLRRSVQELADQGIYPPLKTPPAFAEQRKHLERAKTGDILRKKLTTRPDRQCLVQHHILEDMNPMIDRCAQEDERQKKRSRLQEMLTDHLVHRPGPLDLLSANILKVDPEQQDGNSDDGITFRNSGGLDAAGNGSDLWPVLDDSPDSWTLFCESFDSNTQDSPTSGFPCSADLSSLRIESQPPHNSTRVDLSPPSQLDLLFSSYNPMSIESNSFTIQHNIPTAPDILPLLSNAQLGKQNNTDATVARIPTPPDITPFLENCFKVPTTFTFTSSITSLAQTTATPTVSQPIASKFPSSNRGISKKSRAKIATKSKVIKFHEYRGPPGTQKSSQPQSELQLNVDGVASNLPYNIMLQQQQILLQWQLQQQLQQQNRSFVPVSQDNACTDAKPSSLQVSSTMPSAASSTVKFTSTIATTGSILATNILSSRPTRLEDMKVADLKEACRRLNLSRSGPKPVLIERLLPHAADILNQPDANQSFTSELSLVASDKTVEQKAMVVAPQPLVPMDVDLSCKPEPCMTQGSMSTPPGQYTIVRGGQAMTALNSGLQSNMTVSSSHVALPSNLDVRNGRIILPTLNDQHIPAVLAPTVVPQSVLLPPAAVVNPAHGSQQTLVHVPGPRIIQGRMMPPMDINSASNGIANQSVQCLSRMPHVLLIRPPDSAVPNSSLGNAALSTTVCTRLPDKMAPAVCPPNGVGGTSSASSAMPPVFVFQKSATSTNGVEEALADASTMPERVPLSPEQLVIRQQQHIMQLERHLHQSQQELARAQQEARLRQLTSLDEASRSTSLFWKRPPNGPTPITLSNVNAANMPSPNVVRTPIAVSTVATATSTPIRRTTSMSSRTSDTKLRRSSTIPLSCSNNNEANVVPATYTSMPTFMTSDSCTTSPTLCSSSGSIEDVLEVLRNNGELSCDSSNGVTSSASRNGSIASFYLPDLTVNDNAMSDILSSSEASMDWTDSSSMPLKSQPLPDLASTTITTPSFDSSYKGNNNDIADWIDEFLTPQPSVLSDSSYLPMANVSFDFGDFDPVTGTCNLTSNAFDNLLQMSSSK